MRQPRRAIPRLVGVALPVECAAGSVKDRKCCERIRRQGSFDRQKPQASLPNPRRHLELAALGDRWRGRLAGILLLLAIRISGALYADHVLSNLPHTQYEMVLPREANTGSYAPPAALKSQMHNSLESARSRSAAADFGAAGMEVWRAFHRPAPRSRPLP